MSTSSYTSTVTNPVPARRVVDVLLPENCLEIACLDLNSVLSAMVVRLCSTEAPSLEYSCLAEPSTIDGFYQLLVDEICALKAPGQSPIPFNYEDCLTGGWACGDSACLVVRDYCDASPSDQEYIQALIARSNDYANVINQLCERVTDLEATIVGLQTQVDSVKECC